jgi:prepilin-type N-terminal cleavage/methylation domain-containing protein
MNPGAANRAPLKHLIEAGGSVQNRRGFTLIEILIVIVIIGILAAIAIPKFANSKDRAVLASLKSDLRNLMTAQETYFGDNQTYAPAIGPAPAAGVVAFQPSENNVLTLSTVTSSGWAGEATNPALKGSITKCGVYIGAGTPPNAAVKSEGALACY